MTQTLNAYRFEPLAAMRPHNIVVLLHGLGSNGQDLISLAPIWARSLPNTLFVSPDAPFPCDMAPGMPNSFQWFSLAEWTEPAMLKGAEAARTIVDNFLDNLLKKTGLSDENMALVGFSQGSMMSMYVAPRRTNPCAGVLAYSGALLGASTLNNPDIHKIPTCLIHGDADTVVPITAWHQAKAGLEAANFPVSGEIIRGLPHSIDETGLILGQDFLKSILK